MELFMLQLLNKDRRKHGLKKLFMQDDLRVVARKHSKDMAKKDYFEHENLQGKSHADRYVQAGISDMVSGENLAKIGGYRFPTRRAEIGLMNSPGHRANILNHAYNCVGIGVVKSERQVYYFTQNFAYRTLRFVRRIPRRINYRKGLKLRFKAVAPVQHGLYQLTEGRQKIKEKSFRIQKGKNQLHIAIREPGFYTLKIYTRSSREKSYKASNSIEFFANKGWF